MPFKSEKQRRYLWANEPEIAKDWTDTYGSRIKKSDGGITNVAIQGGVDNYLGEQPQVKAPRSGIMSLDSFGDVGGGGASGGDTEAGGGAMEGRGFSGQGPGQSDRDFDRQKANERAALQIAERAQAKNLGYNERANIANATYGPLQKYTGERGFLGNLFRGANKYGYTDTYTSGPNQGQVKPGYFGRAVGGLGSLLTGIPFVGGAMGTAYDYGKGIFNRRPRDMSQFANLNLYDDNSEKDYIDLDKSYSEFDTIPNEKYKGLTVQRNYMDEPIQSDLVQKVKLDRNEETELGVLQTQKESEDIFGPLTPKQEQRMKELLQKELEV